MTLERPPGFIGKNPSSNDPHPIGSWSVSYKGQPVKSSVAFGSKELADKLAKKLNKMFNLTDFSSVQKQ
jgi:hypothetical protein